MRRHKWANPNIYIPPPTAPNSITVNTGVNVGSPSIYETGVSLVQNQFIGENPANAVTKLGQVSSYAGQHTQYFGGPNLWITSSSPPNPAAAEGASPWGTLDTRINRMETAGQKIILMPLCPYWMQQPLPNALDGTNPSQVNGKDVAGSAAPDPSNFSAMADLVGWIAERYAGRIWGYAPWNEWKGWWDGSTQNWDSANFTILYDMIYDAVKTADPLAKVGGPYMSMGQPDQNGATGTVEYLRLSTGKQVDKRRLRAINYWWNNTTKGADFFCNDGQTKEALAVADWWKTWFPSKTLIYSEFYSGNLDVTGLTSTEANHKRAAQLCYNMMNAMYAGYLTTLVWGPEKGSVGDPYSGAPGNAMWDRDAEATLLDAGIYAKYFQDNFPPGTQLKQVTSSTPLLNGIASSSKLLVAHIGSTTLTTNVNGTVMDLLRDSVTLVDIP